MSYVYKLKTGKRVRCWKCEVRLEKNDECYRDELCHSFCLECGEPKYLNYLFRGQRLINKRLYKEAKRRELHV